MMKIYRRTRDMLIIVISTLIFFSLTARYDLLEELVALTQRHESWELDEIITLSLFLTIALGIFSVRRWIEIRNTSKTLTIRNEELNQALSEIKQLRGILPICAECKKIRDEEGEWQQVETYVRLHSKAEFSHSICPNCMKKLYPEYVHDKKTSHPLNPPPSHNH